MNHIEPEFVAPTGRLLVVRDGLPLIGRVGPVGWCGPSWHYVRWARAGPEQNPKGFCFFPKKMSSPLIFRRWGYIAKCGSYHYGPLRGLAYGTPTCRKCLANLGMCRVEQVLAEPAASQEGSLGRRE